LTYQTTVIKLEGYGPWTLSLGSDREFQLQILQSNIYSDLQELFSNKNGVVFSNRFDEFIAVSNQINIYEHGEIYDQVSSNFDLNTATFDKDVQIIHVDINNSTELTKDLSSYEITNLIIKLYSNIFDLFLKDECLTFYIGGDNFMIISKKHM